MMRRGASEHVPGRFPGRVESESAGLGRSSPRVFLKRAEDLSIVSSFPTCVSLAPLDHPTILDLTLALNTSRNTFVDQFIHSTILQLSPKDSKYCFAHNSKCRPPKNSLTLTPNSKLTSSSNFMLNLDLLPTTMPSTLPRKVWRRRVISSPLLRLEPMHSRLSNRSSQKVLLYITPLQSHWYVEVSIQTASHCKVPKCKKKINPPWFFFFFLDFYRPVQAFEQDVLTFVPIIHSFDRCNSNSAVELTKNYSLLFQTQIGFVDVLKTGNDGKWINEHGKALEESGGDHGKLLINLRRAGAVSTHVVATVDAVTESGEFVVGDGSSTRIVPFMAAAHTIIVVGANKLVKDVEGARERLTSYTFALESARVRKVYGWPSAMLSNAVTVSTSSASPGRLHFVIVKEHLGF
jgi:hypothetical protein